PSASDSRRLSSAPAAGRSRIVSPTRASSECRPEAVSAPTLMMRLALFVCTFGGVGYSPVAPGTAGSAAGLVVYAALRLAGASPVVEALVIALIIVAGV